MGVKRVIELMNEAVAEGVIERYAIGGAVALTFYLEPISTLDVDVFVTFKTTPGEWEEARNFLVLRGGHREEEYVIVADWPVQLLPAVSPLVEEALAQAMVRDVEGTPARVFSLEHLTAIALEASRAKDVTRLVHILESGKLDRVSFMELLQRFDMLASWDEFERKYFP